MNGRKILAFDEKKNNSSSSTCEQESKSPTPAAIEESETPSFFSRFTSSAASFTRTVASGAWTVVSTSASFANSTLTMIKPASKTYQSLKATKNSISTILQTTDAAFRNSIPTIANSLVNYGKSLIPANQSLEQLNQYPILNVVPDTLTLCQHFISTDRENAKKEVLTHINTLKLKISKALTELTKIKSQLNKARKGLVECKDSLLELNNKVERTEIIGNQLKSIIDLAPNLNNPNVNALDETITNILNSNQFKSFNDGLDKLLKILEGPIIELTTQKLFTCLDSTVAIYDTFQSANKAWFHYEQYLALKTWLPSVSQYSTLLSPFAMMSLNNPATPPSILNVLLNSACNTQYLLSLGNIMLTLANGKQIYNGVSDLMDHSSIEHKIEHITKTVANRLIEASCLENQEKNMLNRFKIVTTKPKPENTTIAENKTNRNSDSQSVANASNATHLSASSNSFVVVMNSLRLPKASSSIPSSESKSTTPTRQERKSNESIQEARFSDDSFDVREATYKFIYQKLTDDQLLNQTLDSVFKILNTHIITELKKLIKSLSSLLTLAVWSEYVTEEDYQRDTSTVYTTNQSSWLSILRPYNWYRAFSNMIGFRSYSESPQDQSNANCVDYYVVAPLLYLLELVLVRELIGKKLIPAIINGITDNAIEYLLTHLKKNKNILKDSLKNAIAERLQKKLFNHDEAPSNMNEIMTAEDLSYKVTRYALNSLFPKNDNSDFLNESSDDSDDDLINNVKRAAP